MTDQEPPLLVGSDDMEGVMLRLPTVARLYTQAGRRRASVLDGEGESLVLRSDVVREVSTLAGRVARLEAALQGFYRNSNRHDWPADIYDAATAALPHPLEKLTRIQEDLGLYDDMTPPPAPVGEPPKRLSEAEILAIVKVAPALDTAEAKWLHVARAIEAEVLRRAGGGI